MKCSRCKKEATHQVGIPDPDLPMIPVCEEHKWIVYRELYDQFREITKGSKSTDSVSGGGVKE